MDGPLQAIVNTHIKKLTFFVTYASFANVVGIAVKIRFTALAIYTGSVVSTVSTMSTMPSCLVEFLIKITCVRISVTITCCYNNNQ